MVSVVLLRCIHGSIEMYTWFYWENSTVFYWKFILKCILFFLCNECSLDFSFFPFFLELYMIRKCFSCFLIPHLYIFFYKLLLDLIFFIMLARFWLLLLYVFRMCCLDTLCPSRNVIFSFLWICRIFFSLFFFYWKLFSFFLLNLYYLIKIS